MNKQDTLRIAPSRHRNHWTIEDWRNLNFSKEEDWQTAIDIFEDRIRYRYLNEIDMIIQMNFSGFSVMALDCLLIETLQQFRKGKKETPSGMSEEYFKDFLTKNTAFQKHFDKDKAEKFYKQIRCGILHQAEIKKSSKIWIRKGEPLVRYSDDGEGLFIHRNIFHNLLKQVFEDYVSRLRVNNPPEQDKDLRDNFRKKMNYVCKVKP